MDREREGGMWRGRGVWMEGESVSEETEGRVSGERAGECEWRGGECKCGERERE